MHRYDWLTQWAVKSPLDVRTYHLKWTFMYQVFSDYLKLINRGNIIYLHGSENEKNYTEKINYGYKTLRLKPKQM